MPFEGRNTTQRKPQKLSDNEGNELSLEKSKDLGKYKFNNLNTDEQIWVVNSPEPSNQEPPLSSSSNDDEVDVDVSENKEELEAAMGEKPDFQLNKEDVYVEVQVTNAGDILMPTASFLLFLQQLPLDKCSTPVLTINISNSSGKQITTFLKSSLTNAGISVRVGKAVEVRTTLGLVMGRSYRLKYLGWNSYQDATFLTTDIYNFMVVPNNPISNISGKPNKKTRAKQLRDGKDVVVSPSHVFEMPDWGEVASHQPLLPAQVPYTVPAFWDINIDDNKDILSLNAAQHRLFMEQIKFSFQRGVELLIELEWKQCDPFYTTFCGRTNSAGGHFTRANQIWTLFDFSPGQVVRMHYKGYRMIKDDQRVYCIGVEKINYGKQLIRTPSASKRLTRVGRKRKSPEWLDEDADELNDEDEVYMPPRSRRERQPPPPPEVQRQQQFSLNDSQTAVRLNNGRSSFTTYYTHLDRVPTGQHAMQMQKQVQQPQHLQPQETPPPPFLLEQPQPDLSKYAYEESFVEKDLHNVDDLDYQPPSKKSQRFDWAEKAAAVPLVPAQLPEGVPNFWHLRLKRREKMHLNFHMQSQGYKTFMRQIGFPPQHCCDIPIELMYGDSQNIYTTLRGDARSSSGAFLKANLMSTHLGLLDGDNFFKMTYLGYRELKDGRKLYCLRAEKISSGNAEGNKEAGHESNGGKGHSLGAVDEELLGTEEAAAPAAAKTKGSDEDSSLCKVAVDEEVAQPKNITNNGPKTAHLNESIPSLRPLDLTRTEQQARQQQPERQLVPEKEKREPEKEPSPPTQQLEPKPKLEQQQPVTQPEPKKQLVPEQELEPPTQQQQQRPTPVQQRTGEPIIRLVAKCLTGSGLDRSLVIKYLAKYSALTRADKENYGTKILELAAESSVTPLQQFLENLFGKQGG